MYRRSISSRFTTLLTRRLHPSFSHLIHDDEDKQPHSPPKNPSQPQTTKFPHHEFHNTNTNNAAGLGALFQDRRHFPSSLPMGLGSSFCSYSSSTIGEGSDNIEYMSDVAEVLVEKSAELVVSQTSILNEVAIAAADSFLPVAGLQYLIGSVHALTGLNWWAAIALTTILMRCATIPLLIHQIKAITKMSLVRPQMEEIKQKMNNSMDPEDYAEGHKQIKKLLNKHGVNPFSPLMGLFIQGPLFVSFYLAISNMAEKVPSFKGGGALWFTDLTTPDALYILPVVTALSFLITVEFNMQDGMEGNPMAGTMKKFSRVLAVMMVPFTINFPKAIFCYWVSSNLFSLVYGSVIKRPPVKKFLGIPQIVPPPATTAPMTNISPFWGSKSMFERVKFLLDASKSTKPAVSSSPIEESKSSDRKISSSSAISQRIKILERSVKGRKKNKKREGNLVADNMANLCL
ncbi:mitochondrial inner membrane protein OXA1-like [Tasmannia lanceolata]|uniref:mitochondrial inner membrane protein OXA1-like n=1 Tax=Tasmannia lanceolata TaxID=3420 RepID=UPI00406409E8